MRRARRRPGYSLLEILLALLIAVMLMAALSSAIGFQLRHAQIGRDLTGESTLARSVVNRIENDIVSAAGLSDPGRFRNLARQQQMQSGAAQPATTGGTTPAAPTASTSGGSGASVTTSGSGSSVNSSGTQAESADSTADGSTTEQQGFTGPVTLPLAVIGDGTSFFVYSSKVPGEAYGQQGGQGVGDVRRISYWMTEGGLCRQEIRSATAGEAMNMALPGDAGGFLIAPEVRSAEFMYFDGTAWTDSWDSTVPGDDGVTPIGSPRAVAVRLGFVPPGAAPDAELKYVRHVIALPTANGITQATNGDGTTPPATP